MERFVTWIVGGGVALVVGLWLVSLFGTRSPLWLAGVGLVAVGVGGLSAGIATEIELPSG